MNCKPGDLAYVVYSDFPENVGAVVEVLPDTWVDPIRGFCWLVKFRSPAPCWDHVEQRNSTSDVMFFRDIDLRPISGVPVEDEVLDEVRA